MSGLVLVRSDCGDGGWSLHRPGATDDEIADGGAPPLVCGPARWDERAGDWDRPNAADYARAWERLRGRRMSREGAGDARLRGPGAGGAADGCRYAEARLGHLTGPCPACGERPDEHVRECGVCGADIAPEDVEESVGTDGLLYCEECADEERA